MDSNFQQPVAVKLVNKVIERFCLKFFYYYFDVHYLLKRLQLKCSFDTYIFSKPVSKQTHESYCNAHHQAGND